MAGIDVSGVLSNAIALHQGGDAAGAERGYRQILQIQPAHPDALHLLGVICGDRGDLAAGIDLIKRALKASPALPSADYHIGNLYLRAGQFDQAERHYRKAAAAQPGDALVRNNLGGVLLQKQRYKEASEWFAAALERDPTLTTALNNYALACEVEGRYDDVIPAYDRVLALAPDDVNAHYYRALTLLSRGRLSEGWSEHTWRWQRPDTAALHGRFDIPYWQGEDVRERQVLVWTEQGPGDELIAASMVSDLIERGARVTLLCSPRLVPILQRALPEGIVASVATLHDDAVLRQDFAFQASMSELGAHLRPTLESFPRRSSFLAADPARAAALRGRYLSDEANVPLIGISWRSRAVHLEREKTLPLVEWLPILRTPGVRFVSLQYGDVGAELDHLRATTGISVIADAEVDPLTNLDGFVDQVAAMDLVISVSNTTVHFAGALGKPAWTLLSAARGRPWYWFLSRADSPWYPSMRLFRQSRAGVWRDPIDQVAAALAQWLGER